jgi:hypothetical protein
VTTALTAARPIRPAEHLEREIDSALRPLGGQIFGLVDAARLLSRNPEMVRSLLVALMARPERLDEIAHRSWWHSNGFAKIKLVEARDFCLRLHVWPAGIARLDEVNPHGHRWEFASWIAAGRGTMETFYRPTSALDPAGAQFLRCEYRSSAGTGVLRPGGPAWLRKVGTRCLPAGQVYPCSLDTLHTVTPLGDGLLATVVVQGTMAKPSTTVYLDPSRDPDQPATSLSAARLRGLFADVVAAIGR